MNAKTWLGLACGAVLVSTLGCGSGDDPIYLAGDSAGEAKQTDFFADYASTPAIYVIIPVPDGTTEQPVKVSIQVRSVFGVDAKSLYPDPILVATVKPVDQTNPHRIAIRFPDPGLIEEVHADNPALNHMIQPPRAVGKFTAVVERNGQTDTATFEVVPAKEIPTPNDDPNVTYEYDPTTGASMSTPGAGQCTTDNVGACPKTDKLESVRCCNPTQSCGTGILGTGLCY